MRWKLLIAYDGRSFAGWQSQRGGNTIQDRLEAAFFTLCQEPVSVQGSGRTDAGVHAIGQVAHVEVPRDFPAEKWLAALNGNLPPEIRILRVTPAPKQFHARFDAAGKVYRYRIWNDAVLHPMELGRVWHVPHLLDLALLRSAAARIAGTHDFAGFAANRGKPVPDTVRTLLPTKIRSEGPLVTLTFEGNGFLYKMVRLLTGSLVQVARGREEPEWITRLLEAKGYFKTHHAAPAEGLTLVRVRY